MARLKAVEENKFLKHWHLWSQARSEAKDASTGLGEIVKAAIEDLNIGKKPFKIAAELRRQDAVKASAFIRDLKKACIEMGVADENFDPVQTDLEDAIKNTPPAA